jgi:hypothetical protein
MANFNPAPSLVERLADPIKEFAAMMESTMASALLLMDSGFKLVKKEVVKPRNPKIENEIPSEKPPLDFESLAAEAFQEYMGLLKQVHVYSHFPSRLIHCV